MSSICSQPLMEHQYIPSSKMINHNYCASTFRHVRQNNSIIIIANIYIHVPVP